MATWLHDDDTIRYLAEENGDVRDWARFHALARGASNERPTHPLYAPVASLLGEGALDAWGARALQEASAIPEFTLLYQAGRLVTTTDAWVPPLRDALTTPYGPHAANLLVGLQHLRPEHLAPLAERHPDAATWFAWLVTAAPSLDTIAADLAERIQADLAADGHRCEASITLLTQPSPAFKTAEEALRQGCEHAGISVPPMGPGSTHNRARTAVRALGAHLPAPTRWLVEQILEASSPVPPAIAYGVAAAAGDLRIDPAVPGHPAYPLVHAAHCAAHPDDLLATLAADRPLGLRIARFVPTEETLEQLLALPVPADPEERVDLALALAMMASPTTSTAIRGILEHVSNGDRAFVSRVYSTLVGTELG